MAKLESKFQADLIKEIRNKFPGSMILKNDPNYIQGFPDLTILFPNGRWAVLECKRSADASHQANQDYYVEELNAMSFASFVFPENKEEIVGELLQRFQST